MKKIFTGLVILSALAFFGCNKGGEDPKVVLISFFEALSKKDVAKARTLATAESKSMLDLMEVGVKKDTTTNDKFNKENLEFGEVKIEGDKAIVPVKEKGSGVTVNYTLKNEKGWKVAFDKATMMKMGMESASENGGLVDSLSSQINNETDINVDSLKKAINSKLQGMDTLSAE